MPTESPRRSTPEPSAQLPRTLQVDKPETFTFTISDDLPKWGDMGRVHEVALRVMLSAVSEIDKVTFKLNGKTLPDGLRRTINQMYRLRSPRHRIFGYWFIFKLDSDHWPKQGENELEITLEHRDTVLTMDAGRPGCRAGHKVPHGQELPSRLCRPGPRALRILKLGRDDSRITPYSSTCPRRNDSERNQEWPSTGRAL